MIIVVVKEIERKFLIRMPDREALLSIKGAQSSRIAQTYLLGEGKGSERVRARKFSDGVCYTHTKKLFVSPLCSEEEEREISEEEYLTLLLRRDPTRQTVEKERICIPFGAHILEIDLYPFWEKQAVLEVELASEAEECPLPPFLSILREVTAEGQYKNRALAKVIPPEEA